LKKSLELWLWGCHSQIWCGS